MGKRRNINACFFLYGQHNTAQFEASGDAERLAIVVCVHSAEKIKKQASSIYDSTYA
jgi:hypothetical protein